MKTLHLTLKKEPFDLMVSGEKKEEFRNHTRWIKSRLFNKDGTLKDYDYVKFTNGYGKNRPYFIAIYLFFKRSFATYSKVYSNGFKVDVHTGDFIIYLGSIIEKGNIKT